MIPSLLTRVEIYIKITDCKTYLLKETNTHIIIISVYIYIKQKYELKMKMYTC